MRRLLPQLVKLIVNSARCLITRNCSIFLVLDLALLQSVHFVPTAFPRDDGFESSFERLRREDEGCRLRRLLCWLLLVHFDLVVGFCRLANSVHDVGSRQSIGFRVCVIALVRSVTSSFIFFVSLGLEQ